MNSFGPGEAILGMGFILVFLMVLALFVWSLVWVYGDAERRGKSGCLVALLAALIHWPLSLLLWLVFRPATPYYPRR